MIDRVLLQLDFTKHFLPRNHQWVTENMQSVKVFPGSFNSIQATGV